MFEFLGYKFTELFLEACNFEQMMSYNIDIMKYGLILFVCTLIAVGCKNNSPESKEYRTVVCEVPLSVDDEDEEEEVKIFYDTTRYAEYYAVEHGTGQGNYTTMLSVYRTANDSLVVDDVYPIEQNRENQLILYQESDGEHRILVLDLDKHKLHDVDVPQKEEFRGFGCQSCYSVGKVTPKRIEVLYDCEVEKKFRVKR